MRRCLALAAQGRGLVGNGATAGAALVRDGKIIAEGWHRGFGKTHAERDLLETFTGKVLPTDTLYINLEPCVGFPGKKTSPCSNLLIERGVKRLVCGMADPDPRVGGKGIELLRSKGVDVVASCLPEECARLNRGYVSVRTKGRPWITLKSARMPDGKFRNDDGSRLKITTPDQDKWSHAFLRARHDAIMVGVGTILIDNPSLTTRLTENPPCLHRIIIDPNLRIPHQAKVLTDACAAFTMVVVDPDIIRRDPAKLDPIIKHGARVIPVDTDTQGNIILEDLWNVLLTPKDGYSGITSILLEGGPRTWDMFRKEGVVDQEVTLVGPTAA